MEKIKNKGHFITVGTLISIFTVITPVMVQQFNRIHDKIDKLDDKINNKPYVSKNEIVTMFDMYTKRDPTRERNRQDIEKNKNDIYNIKLTKGGLDGT